jgi:hypothetical protein
VFARITCSFWEARLRSNGLFGLFLAIAACGAMTFASASIAPTHASAQCMGTAASPCVTPVRPDGKGMIGLGLIGGEIGLIVPAIIQNAAHTNEWWPYLVFPLIGIGAGIGGGYALEQATPTQPEIDIGIMIGAAVLIVPTIIGTLALASWTPPAESVTADDDMEYEDTSDSGDSVEAVQDDASATPDTSSTPPPSDTSSDTSSSSTGPTSMLGGPGLIRMDADTHQLAVGIPILGAVGRYASEELSALHLVQQYDMNVPLVSGTF